jgi:hypothetical protein
MKDRIFVVRFVDRLNDIDFQLMTWSGFQTLGKGSDGNNSVTYWCRGLALLQDKSRPEIIFEKPRELFG